MRGHIVPRGLRYLNAASVSPDSDPSEASGWQRDVDKVLDIDTDCDTRRDLVTGLFSQADTILKDVQEALADGDIKKLAPPSLGYGKAVEGLEAVQRQVVSDIIPDLLSKGPVGFLKAQQQLAGSSIATNNVVGGLNPSKLIEEVQSFSSDPSKIQSTVDSLRTEIRNVFKSIPEGLQGPTYRVIKATQSYEIRFYDKFSVCRTTASRSLGTDTNEFDHSNSNGNGDDMMDVVIGGRNFNVLAGYIFGGNTNNEDISMTTPVYSRGKTMEFVLADGITSSDAPIPNNNDVEIADIPERILAVRSFPGIATEGEVGRQRAHLEDALLADGIVYDNLSFTTAQFNPPYTLPWLRKNEISLEITYNDFNLDTMRDVDESSMPSDAASPEMSMTDSDIVLETEIENKDEIDGDGEVFETSPEAGD